MRQVPYHDQDRTYQPDDPLNPNYDPNPQPTPPTPAPTDPDEAPPDPWATAPEDGNWERWFLSNIKGTPATPEALAALTDALAKHGITVMTNAEGIAGKIKLPDGSIVDVGRRFSGGDPSRMEWQWLTGSGDGAQSGDWFDANAPKPPDYTTPTRPDHLQGPYTPPTWPESFTAPSVEQMYADPGYQARFESMQRGLERSAAARGSVLSGGFVGRTMPRELGNFAAQEYGNVYGRAYDAYKQKYGEFADKLTADAGARAFNERTYQDDVMNAQNQYGLRYRSYRDAIGDQFRLSEMGLDATTGGRP